MKNQKKARRRAAGKTTYNCGEREKNKFILGASTAHACSSYNYLPVACARHNSLQNPAYWIGRKPPMSFGSILKPSMLTGMTPCEPWAPR